VNANKADNGSLAIFTFWYTYFRNMDINCQPMSNRKQNFTESHARLFFLKTSSSSQSDVTTTTTTVTTTAAAVLLLLPLWYFV